MTNTTETDSNYITVRQAVERYGFKKSKIYAMCAANEIVSIRAGSGIRLEEGSLKNALGFSEQPHQTHEGNWHSGTVDSIKSWPNAFWESRVDEHGCWDFFCTLTFRRDTTNAAAKRTAERWLSNIARLEHAGHFLSIYAIEPQRSGRPHAHALISLNPALDYLPSARAMRGLWKSGISHVVEFNPDLDGVGYVMKSGEVEMLVACPREKRCRRKGCRFGSIGDHAKK